MSAAEDSMNTLSAQWYNAVSTGISAEDFQLMQGHMPLPTTTEKIWNIFDSVPPMTATTFYNPAQVSRFSSNYAGVLTALIPQGQEQLVSDLGDSYAAWIEYRKAIKPYPAGEKAWIQAFSDWAQANVDPSSVASAISDYRATWQDPIVVAQGQIDNVENADPGSHPGEYAYTITYLDVNVAVTKGQSQHVDFDSATESSDVEHTWAQGESSGIFDFFGGVGGDASYDSLTMQLASAGVRIDASFGKLVTCAAGPLAAPSDDATLNSYVPWFNSGALGEAYAKADNTVWKSGDDISWDSTFGPHGNLQRFASAIIVVDDVKVTMTSSAALSSDDQAQFKAAAATNGFWPFFSVSGQGGWQHDVTFDDQGHMNVSSTCVAGNLQILGVLVSPTSGLF